MAERTDITVDWAESPRLIEVADPSAEVVLQDLHDTLRADTGVDYAESDLDNLDEPYLIDSAGKEALGGGVLVGITSTLQNAQLAFESRLTPTETGTVTTANAAGTSLIDSAATFTTNGVTRGAVVINFTDESITEVVEVVSQTELRTRVLRSGTDNDYDLNDSYKVWNIEQCNIAGGNLVALDNLQAELDPVFPTAFTQIVRTSSSSATLQELADIQYASFDGAVHYDSTSPFSGTAYPKGTPRQPVNSLTDALSIANNRGFDEIHIIGDATIPVGPDFSGLRFVGQSATRTVLTIPAAATVDECEYLDAFVTGTLDGQAIIERCVVGTLDLVSGFIYLCGLQGPITLGSGIQANFLDCFSLVAGGGSTPVIDLGGSGQALTIRNYNGGIELRNKTGTDAASVDMASGQVIINDNCTGGAITLRGVGKWTNKETYAGTTDVVDEMIYGIYQRDMWQLMGLDKSNPLTVTKTSQAAGGVNQTISGDGENTSVVTRT
jgi:hypothetical protein